MQATRDARHDDAPHRRQNILTGDWVLVSPHRMKRPWQGRIEKRADEQRPDYDPACYLCPRNERAGGAANPDYAGVHVFTNDYAALVPQPSGIGDRAAATKSVVPKAQSPKPKAQSRLLKAEPESGTSRVVCFSPRHDLALPELDVASIRAVVDVWAREYAELGARDDIGWVQIFENKGELMGCSNPHPHGQIWAQCSVPGEPAKEAERQRAYFEERGGSLLGDYLALELELGERVVLENDAFVVLVPFWAVWPFETIVVPREHRRSLLDLSDAERDALADILKRLTTRYDNLFETAFPYSAGIHQAPTDGEPHDEWQLHMHFYPPLLRSATVKKFMVGYEMLGEAQRDLTPEASAERLRQVDETHYRARAR
ncbi:MAG TPA: UDP-glucose--hexose-1-phosphate uridylyltransferase [Longimicrobiales bacterium]|nr:UDP-glucose--hexose-1-phosphate uridylyltransferase [Longimicrobiales bacterium]